MVVHNNHRVAHISGVGVGVCASGWVLSRVNKSQEGHGWLKDSYDVPKKKRKHRPKGFRLPKKVTAK